MPDTQPASPKKSAHRKRHVIERQLPALALAPPDPDILPPRREVPVHRHAAAPSALQESWDRGRFGDDVPPECAVGVLYERADSRVLAVVVVFVPGALLVGVASDFFLPVVPPCRIDAWVCGRSVPENVACDDGRVVELLIAVFEEHAAEGAAVTVWEELVVCWFGIGRWQDDGVRVVGLPGADVVGFEVSVVGGDGGGGGGAGFVGAGGWLHGGPVRSEGGTGEQQQEEDGQEGSEKSDW